MNLDTDYKIENLTKKEFYKDSKKTIKSTLKLINKYKKKYPNMDENILKKKISKILIKKYAMQAGFISILMCGTSILPLLMGTIVSSVGGAIVEKIFVLDKSNKNLMIALSIINDYECDEENLKNIKASSYIQMAWISICINFFARLSDLIPVVGQIIVGVIALPICFFVNHFVVSKFGEMTLNEFNLEID